MTPEQKFITKEWYGNSIDNKFGDLEKKYTGNIINKYEHRLFSLGLSLLKTMLVLTIIVLLI